MYAPESRNSDILSLAYMNIRGQTGLTITKQVQIESFLHTYKPDILHLQEIDISEDSFSSCDFINSSYNIICNNAINKYGTASLVSSELEVSNLKFDTEGRIIVFDIDNATFANVY
jgi:exonuclease III